jgi:hypothetical protein
MAEIAGVFARIIFCSIVFAQLLPVRVYQFRFSQAVPVPKISRETNHTFATRILEATKDIIGVIDFQR